MQVKLKITTEQISNLIISALEGGSNYWYMIEKEIVPTKWIYENDKGERFKKEGKHWIQDYPLNPGGALIISDAKLEGEIDKITKKRLGLMSIKKGLMIMHDKYPSHFADILSEDDDAETGDVFLQCCLFGDIIYG